MHGRRPLSRTLCWAAALVALTLHPACAPGTASAQGAIGPFLEAVQEKDLDRLYCLMAGAAGPGPPESDETTRREEFRARVLALYDRYQEGRDEGWVEPDGSGVILVKMFTLGKGTYYELRDARAVGPDSMQVRMDLRFGYGAIRLSRFSPGTTFYFCGAPVGRIHAIRVPSAGEDSAEVLKTLSLEWTLLHRERPTEGCAAGWTVSTVRPLEDTLTTERVTWVF